jgi:aminomethyltransferase
VPEGQQLWGALAAAGATRCGLGARDTLRLEAALNLYGQDMDGDTSPLESGLAWTVAFEPADREFRGRAALERQRAAGVRDKLAGLLLEDRGIMRHGQRVQTAAGEGIITSGGFSPTMERSIALARVPAGAAGTCAVEIRGELRAARIVGTPFVRRGRVLVDGLGPARTSD